MLILYPKMKMKAAIYTHYGPPEVVSIGEVSIPTIKHDEILVQVVSSTVNRTDAGFRSAGYFISRFWSGLFRPKFKTLGCTFSGTVDKTGELVARFKPGDAVFGFNDQQFGGHAEYTVQKAEGPMAKVPVNISLHEAAAIPEGANYALVNLRAAKVGNGSKVLVYGATGAIGSAAVQLVKSMGAWVTAVCATPYVGLVKTLGADKVVDYLTEDFTKTGLQYDLVFDAVGKTSFGVCKSILKPKGIYISTELGKGGQNVFLAIWGSMFKNQKRVLFPIPTFSKEDMEWLADKVKIGAFKPVIDRSYKLEEIVEAYRYVEQGQKVGNVLLEIRKEVA
jgi:NADPH:quinone reductase-like Zn-dependent oxidoreductase